MIKTITIYRIQDHDGRGPYKPGFSHAWTEDRKDLYNLTPWYEEFPHILYRLPDYQYTGCGCPSLDMLRRWFTKTEYKRLKRLGYRAVALQADRILAVSDIQCVFTKTSPLNENIKRIKLY